MKRAFSLVVGLGAGLLLGAYAIKKMDAAQRAVAPANLAGQAGRAAGALIERLRDAGRAGKLAAEAREGELRGQFQIPTLRQVLDPKG